jgi:outer membrane protein OmpA-like peptidoglycan-associated protein
LPRPLRITAIALATLLVLVAAYAAVGFLLVPRLVTSQLETSLAEELSLEVRVEHVSFDPFDLRLVARGFGMRLPGEPDAASLEELRIDLDAGALFGGRIDFEEVFLESPMAELRVGEHGELRVAGIAVGEGSVEAVPEEEPGDVTVPALLLRDLVVRRGSFRVRDLSRNPAVERAYGPIDLQVADLDLTALLREAAEHEPSTGELTIDLGGGARFSAQGDVDVEPLGLDLKLELSGLSLQPFEPWLGSVARLDVRDGAMGLSGRLRVGGDAGPPGSVHFAGRLGVSSLDLAETGKPESLVAWKSLELSGIDLRSEPLALAIGQVELVAPVVRLTQRADGLNVARVFSVEAEAAEAETAEAENVPANGERPAPGAGSDEAFELPVSIGPVRLASGTLRFEDATVSPRARFELEDLTASADRVTTDAAGRTKLEATAKAFGYAPIAVRGTLAPMAPDTFTDLHFSAEGIELASFSPYAGRYVGNGIEGGRGTARVDLRIEQRKVSGKNEIVLQALDFGAKVESPDATTMPVVTAAALLANSDGEIVMDMPVEGDLDDPNFSYRGALLDTVRSMAGRVVGMPLKIVGGMVALGGRLISPSELVQVGFAPGSRRLERQQKDKLDVLAAGLEAKASLRIDVRGGANSSLDGDEDLRALARRRAGAVRDYLVDAGVDEGAVGIGDVRIGSDDEAGSGRVVTHLELR